MMMMMTIIHVWLAHRRPSGTAIKENVSKALHTHQLRFTAQVVETNAELKHAVFGGDIGGYSQKSFER